MMPARPLAARVAALGIAGAFAAPIPASAAPSPPPCERTGAYAAQSGAELLRLRTLDLRTADRTEAPITDVGLASAKSALITTGKVNSAAVSQLSSTGGSSDLTRPLAQQAPPAHPRASTRNTDAGTAGPFTVGTGTMSAHARWAPGMSCAAAEGEAARATTTLTMAAIPGADETGLVVVRTKIGGLSTTTLEGRGPTTRSVATATLGTGTINLLHGTVRIRIQQAPSLLATMATDGGGEVRYSPAILEVSGPGIHPTRLTTPGDSVEITVPDQVAPPSTESASLGGPPAGPRNGGLPAGRPTPIAGLPGRPGLPGPHDLPSLPSGHATPISGLPGRPGLAGLRDLPSLPSGRAIPIPGRPGQPGLPGPRDLSGLTGLTGLPTVPGDDEAAQVAGPGTKLRISLGVVRQATAGQAVAARVSAIKIALTHGATTPTKEANAARTPARSGVLLDLSIGVLEAGALAPAPAPADGVVLAAAAGAGGALPITGARIECVALAGVALLGVGMAALVVGLRGRRLRR